MTFEQLDLIEPILRALKSTGYTQPTPIQEQAIPSLLQKRDLLGCAQTGTGKTAAFAIPTLQTLYGDKAPSKGYRHIRTLVLTPTRELAIQIHESFITYGQFTGLTQEVIYGGVSQHPQTRALERGTDILVATPGRLLDLMNQGYVYLDHLEIFVLDEADRMLDMGFINDVRKVIRELPVKRQTLLFSATMPSQISQLADSLLHNPVKVAVTPVATTAEKVEQTVYMVDRRNKQMLLEHLIKQEKISRALVFSRTKHGADRIAKNLNKARIDADSLHGDKTQGARQRALENFKNNRLTVLVATDIAARGIDVDSLSHVINFDMPDVPETYVHRIGRTGRAGATGIALSFCDRDERINLRDINRTTSQNIEIKPHPFETTGEAHAGPDQQGAHRPPPQHRSRPGQQGGQRNQQGGGQQDRGSRKPSQRKQNPNFTPKQHGPNPVQP